MDNRKNLPLRSRTTREIAVCVPTEQVARKSAANDAVGKGIRMEAAFATAAPSSPTFIMMLQPVCSMRSRFSTLSVAPLAEDRRQEIRLGKRPVGCSDYISLLTLFLEFCCYQFSRPTLIYFGVVHAGLSGCIFCEWSFSELANHSEQVQQAPNSHPNRNYRGKRVENKAPAAPLYTSPTNPRPQPSPPSPLCIGGVEASPICWFYVDE